jgi:3-methyladenine DNA glycosylase/8-oxoguanine DNA glycosylase
VTFAFTCRCLYIDFFECNVPTDNADDMISQRFQIQVPSGFNFWCTVYSHGWCSLPPFSVQKESGTFSRIVTLDDGTLAECILKDGGEKINVLARTEAPLTREHRKDVRQQLSSCFRLGEDFSTFHAAAKRTARFRWVTAIGAGRMLRAPSVFEDVVKMMCTTNCSWALTEAMVHNLTTRLGKEFGDGKHSFPTPETIAGTTETYIRKYIKAGYRSPFLLELSERVADGTLDIESWRSSPASTEELFETVKSVKGMGDYAAGNILKLLGRYDYLGLDSWVRSKFYELHARGRKVKDSTIDRHYKPYGTYRGLYFWLEMTRDWYKEKFPF